jgi:hypothetical protein
MELLGAAWKELLGAAWKELLLLKLGFSNGAENRHS